MAASDTGPSPTIAAYRARIGERIPLTFSQYRVWQLQHLYRDNAMYNLPRAFRVRGPLHPEAVRTALSGLARRHETLRSRITADADGFPFQCIAPEPSLDFGFVDLSGQSPAAAAASAERLLHEAAVAPFDLGQGPLRGRCLKLGTDDWLLLFVVHHVAADDASWRPFLSDFTALYTAAVSGGAASLPALPLSYSALARSQWQALTDERMAQAHAYWRGFFASDQGSEPGPADGEHGSVRYEILPQSISAATIAACKAAAARQGGSLFTLVLAAIARLVGQLYDEPRRILAAIPGVELVEMPRHGAFSFCCGMGGGLKLANEGLQHRMGAQRIREAEGTGAEAIVTPCQTCCIGLANGVAETGSGLRVLHLNEVVARAVCPEITAEKVTAAIAAAR